MTALVEDMQKRALCQASDSLEKNISKIKVPLRYSTHFVSSCSKNVVLCQIFSITCQCDGVVQL